jgi:SNF2 family DNA or RNA helicase
MFELWGHQKRALALALKQKDFAFFHDMGTGKTGTLINVLRHKYAERGHIRRTLILSPLVTLQNWKREFKNFSRISENDIIVLGGTGAKRVAQFQYGATDPVSGDMTRNRIFITNYESMQVKGLIDLIERWRPEIIICDEAHRLRNHKSIRAKAVCRITDKAEHTYIATGSPILNSAQDVFHQYKILNSGKTFGDNFFAFRGRYFVDSNASWAGKTGYFPDYNERPELFEELHRKMYFDQVGRPIADRVLKKDCLDLPPLVRTTIEVELSSEQRKIYTEMKNEFITYVQKIKDEGKPIAVVATLAVTKALRMQQIVTGFAKGEDGIEYPIQDNPRLEALADLLEDVGQNKVIVWACFKENYKQIAKVCDDLKLPYCQLHGELNIKEKEASMKAFREDPSIKVMIANQAAGGVGVNLVEAPVAIFYSRNFSLENDLQAEARNYRGGSEIHQKVTRYDLIAKNSIDELISDCLVKKQSISDQIVDLNRMKERL